LAAVEIVFYDGQCGLCHRGVKFILKRDPPPGAFRFAPLQGETFRAMIAPARLADSIIVRTADGALLDRSGAWIHILRRLGGGWKMLAAIIALVPRPLRDGVYALVARVRHRLFRRPSDLCPVVPPELRERFEG
jgi:predicted DCC family thiol-disulfide oxidoreductase YuxK